MPHDKSQGHHQGLYSLVVALIIWLDVTCATKVAKIGSGALVFVVLVSYTGHTERLPRYTTQVAVNRPSVRT